MKKKFLIAAFILSVIGVWAQKADPDKLTFYLMDKVSAYNRQAAAAHRAGETAKDQLLLVLVQADSEDVLTDEGCVVLDHVYDVDAPIYNLRGERVDKSQKGLVIYRVVSI